VRIIVNAVPLSNITTGIGRYIREVYTCIQNLYPEIEIRYFDGIRICRHMPVPPQGKGIWTFAADLAWRLPAFFPYMARVFAHEISTRRFYRLSQRFDIYHEAGYFPFKTPESVKTLFTIHDMSLKTLPGYHPKDRVLFFRKYFEKSLPHVDAIITPSEFTKKEIKKAYPAIPSESIHTVPLGYDKSLFRLDTQDEIDGFKSRMRLPEKYVLFVGTFDPRKNIQTLLKALARLPVGIQLVCAGWSGWEKTIERSLSAFGIKKRIIFTGYVSDSELALLYSGARVFVYPSYYEGFGLPVLEAMACGCPVICSNAASLPEVAGEAAAYCTPDDAAGLANSIQDIFSCDNLYKQMSERSLVRAQRFNWSKTAEKTLSVFC